MLTRRWLFAAVFAAAAFAAPALARAEDEGQEVKPADVPKAVVEAVAKRYPGGKVTHWESETEKGATFYAAQVEVASKDKDGKESVRKVEVALTAEGKFVAEEERIAADALPAEVKKAIAAGPYAKATIKGVERSAMGEKLDVLHFEVVFVLDGKVHEVTYDAAGKVLEDESDDDDDEKDEGGGMR